MTDTKETKALEAGEYKVGYKHPPLESRFSSTHQASFAAKSLGQRARYAREKARNSLIYWFSYYGTIKLGKAKIIAKDMEEHPNKYTLDQLTALKLRMDKKYITYTADQVMGKATQAVDLQAEGTGLDNIKVTIVDPKDNK